ncbi:hypothetical protein K469DRAFT_684544 [Zopfia rhizophila CBS 207.26]|uniref:Uncharacterized protein n=1 Tax=Zopfia rhizophila CBS 207.26 TaxID=1314779 RepID=A0A6A6EF52_9PEZI|nr:hypothetical protein K469DRAFT_684544 [Zopfia rhizophila CBS 207.26]
MSWASFTFPTNPIAPGPRARQVGGLLPITTVHGRNYLVYFLGAREKVSDHSASPGNKVQEVTQWSDMWTLQLPSSDMETRPKLGMREATKPTGIKNTIRSALGAQSGRHTWARVEVAVPPDSTTLQEKLYPRPRAHFGYDVLEDGTSVVF